MTRHNLYVSRLSRLLKPERDDHLRTRRRKIHFQIWSDSSNWIGAFSNSKLFLQIFIMYLSLSARIICVRIYQAESELQYGRKLSTSHSACFISGTTKGLEFFSPWCDCYCGICTEINLVHNHSDPVIWVSIKEVSAFQRKKPFLKYCCNISFLSLLVFSIRI